MNQISHASFDIVGELSGSHKKSINKACFAKNKTKVLLADNRIRMERSRQIEVRGLKMKLTHLPEISPL